MYNPPVGRQRIPLQSQQITAFLKAFVDKIRKPVEDLCPFLLLGTAFDGGLLEQKISAQKQGVEQESIHSPNVVFQKRFAARAKNFFL